MLPAGALHIEGDGDETVVYIVATRDLRPFNEIFKLRPADDAERSRRCG